MVVYPSTPLPPTLTWTFTKMEVKTNQPILLHRKDRLRSSADQFPFVRQTRFFFTEGVLPSWMRTSNYGPICAVASGKQAGSFSWESWFPIHPLSYFRSSLSEQCVCSFPSNRSFSSGTFNVNCRWAIDGCPFATKPQDFTSYQERTNVNYIPLR